MHARAVVSGSGPYHMIKGGFSLNERVILFVTKKFLGYSSSSSGYNLDVASITWIGGNTIIRNSERDCL